jgi:hypothetical protein
MEVMVLVVSSIFLLALCAFCAAGDNFVDFDRPLGFMLALQKILQWQTEVLIATKFPWRGRVLARSLSRLSESFAVSVPIAVDDADRWEDSLLMLTFEPDNDHPMHTPPSDSGHSSGNEAPRTPVTSSEMRARAKQGVMMQIIADNDSEITETRKKREEREYIQASNAENERLLDKAWREGMPDLHFD